MRDRASRYQYQSWLVRRWRDRHLVPVPWHALRTWLHQFGSERPLPWRHCWSIERGMADVRRNYVYDFSELRDDLSERDKPGRIAQGKSRP